MAEKKKSRSTYVEDVYDVVSATTLEAVFEQQAKNVDGVIEDIEKYIEDLKAEVEAGDFRGTRKELEDAIFARAFVDCQKVIKDKALNFLVTEAVNATVATEEFNYPAYHDHLLGAMEANKDGLIGIIARKQKRQVEVKVNAHLLGKPGEWGAAIKKYREDKGIGKLSAEDKKVGSKVWREKIYGVGREGGQVKRYYKRDQVTVDVTDKYRDKYRETVEGRLALIPDNKAPFWYLIEHGNVQKGKELKLDTDGIPYPSFAKTNFVSNSEQAIADAFAQIWTQYEEAARDLIEGLEDERVRKLRKSAEEKVASGEFDPEESKVIEIVEIAEGELTAIQHEWGTEVSLRNPKTGRWAALPRGR